MVKRAIIYTRVSTDEQNNGYSPADQKEKLYRYCENNNIDVVGFYHDDASGKSFERPEWKKIMDFLRKNKNSVEKDIRYLFTKKGLQLVSKRQILGYGTGSFSSVFKKETTFETFRLVFIKVKPVLAFVQPPAVPIFKSEGVLN